MSIYIESAYGIFLLPRHMVLFYWHIFLPYYCFFIPVVIWAFGACLENKLAPYSCILSTRTHVRIWHDGWVASVQATRQLLTCQIGPSGPNSFWMSRFSSCKRGSLRFPFFPTSCFFIDSLISAKITIFLMAITNPYVLDTLDIISNFFCLWCGGVRVLS